MKASDVGDEPLTLTHLKPTRVPLTYEETYHRHQVFKQRVLNRMILLSGVPEHEVAQQRDYVNSQLSFSNVTGFFQDQRDRHPMNYRYRILQGLCAVVFMSAGKRAIKKSGLTFIFGGQAICPEYHWAMMGLKPENLKEEAATAKQVIQEAKEVHEKVEKAEKVYEKAEKVEEKVEEKVQEHKQEKAAKSEPKIKVVKEEYVPIQSIPKLKVAKEEYKPIQSVKAVVKDEYVPIQSVKAFRNEYEPIQDLKAYLKGSK